MPSIDVGGSKISYQEAGVGLPIVFIPGLTEYKESFLFQLRALSDKYRIISIDHRVNLTPSVAISDLAEELGRFMDGLRLSSAVIAGHSFGGLIAQQFAQRHPDRTTALILISTFAKSPDLSPRKILKYMSSGHRFEPEGFFNKVKKALGLLPQREMDEDNHLDWVSLQAAKTDPGDLKERIRMIRAFDSRPWLKQLWIPTLILAGQNDRPAFLSAAQFIQRSTPDSVIEVIPDSSHFPHIERYDLFNSYVDDYISARLVSLVE